MITFKEFRILEERVEKITVSNFNDDEYLVKILINPKEVETRAMLNRTKFKELRGLITKKTLVIWDADGGLHDFVREAMAKELSIREDFVHIYILIKNDELIVQSGAVGPLTGTKSLSYILTKYLFLS